MPSSLRDAQNLKCALDSELACLHALPTQASPFLAEVCSRRSWTASKVSTSAASQLPHHARDSSHSSRAASKESECLKIPCLSGKAKAIGKKQDKQEHRNTAANSARSETKPYLGEASLPSWTFGVGCMCRPKVRSCWLTALPSFGSCPGFSSLMVSAAGRLAWLVALNQESCHP